MACVPQDYPVGVEPCKAQPVYVCNTEATVDPLVAELETLIQAGPVSSETWMLRSTVADVNNPIATYQRQIYADGSVIWLDSDGEIIAAPTAGAGESLIPQKGDGGIRTMYQVITGIAAWSLPDDITFKVNKVWINVITVGDVLTPPTLTTPNGPFPLFANQTLEFFIDNERQSLSEVLTVDGIHANDVISIYWTEEDR